MVGLKVGKWDKFSCMGYRNGMQFCGNGQPNRVQFRFWDPKMEVN